MPTPFALALQRLSRGTDRVLVVADLAAARSEDASFESDDVRELFDAFRIPAPSNLPRDLSTLGGRGLLIRRFRSSGWAITPEGQHRARTILPRRSAEVEVAGSDLRTAPFADVAHNLIPFELAPSRWREGIEVLTARTAFEDNAFLMTRFPGTDPSDPVGPVIELARRTLADHGLHLHVASDRVIDPDLLGNVAAHMWGCSYGVSFFECRIQKTLNENLLAEVGAMLMTGRRVALLKDVSVDEFPTDFVGQVYREVDLDDHKSVQRALHAWAQDDLGRPDTAE